MSHLHERLAARVAEWRTAGYVHEAYPLSAARIPAAVEPRTGLDGRTTTLEWKAPGRGARYTWWGTPDDGWKPLQDVVDRIIALSPVPVPGGGP